MGSINTPTHLDGLLVLSISGPDIVDLRGEGGNATEGTLDGNLLTMAPQCMHVAPLHADHREYTLHAEWVTTCEHPPLWEREGRRKRERRGERGRERRRNGEREYGERWLRQYTEEKPNSSRHWNHLKCDPCLTSYGSNECLHDLIGKLSTNKEARLASNQ